jgi:hypothetical protein
MDFIILFPTCEWSTWMISFTLFCPLTTENVPQLTVYLPSSSVRPVASLQSLCSNWPLSWSPQPPTHSKPHQLMCSGLHLPPSSVLGPQSILYTVVSTKPVNHTLEGILSHFYTQSPLYLTLSTAKHVTMVLRSCSTPTHGLSGRAPA